MIVIFNLKHLYNITPFGNMIRMNSQMYTKLHNVAKAGPLVAFSRINHCSKEAVSKPKREAAKRTLS